MCVRLRRKQKKPSNSEIANRLDEEELERNRPLLEVKSDSSIDSQDSSISSTSDSGSAWNREAEDDEINKMNNSGDADGNGPDHDVQVIQPEVG